MLGKLHLFLFYTRISGYVDVWPFKYFFFYVMLPLPQRRYLLGRRRKKRERPRVSTWTTIRYQKKKRAGRPAFQFPPLISRKVCGFLLFSCQSIWISCMHIHYRLEHVQTVHTTHVTIYNNIARERERERVVLMYSNSIWVVPLLLSFGPAPIIFFPVKAPHTHTHTHNICINDFRPSVFSFGCCCCFCRPSECVSAACRAAHCQPSVPIKSHETGNGWSWTDRRSQS